MKTGLFWPALGCVCMALSCSTAASAQQRTFVSGLGNDGNPRSRLAPCRTCTQALSMTNAGGEVVVLDSAGYGAFAISKSVSIIAPPGVYAGISVFAGNGIDINVASTDVVILRGLTVNNQGSMGSGIAYHSGGTLHVESCVVNGFSGSSLSSGLCYLSSGTLEVKGSIFRGNQIGIHVEPASGTAVATIDAVRIQGSGDTGLDVEAGSHVTIRNSVASSSVNSGIGALSTSASDAVLNVESCVASNNGGAGIFAFSSVGAANIKVSNSTITGNAEGFSNQGGASAAILSRGNNTVEGNVTNTVGTIGSYVAK